MIEWGVIVGIVFWLVSSVYFVMTISNLTDVVDHLVKRHKYEEGLTRDELLHVIDTRIFEFLHGMPSDGPSIPDPLRKIDNLEACVENIMGLLSKEYKPKPPSKKVCPFCGLTAGDCHCGYVWAYAKVKKK